MNKEEFEKEQMRLSKEAIIANYWYTYQDNVEKLGIEHQLNLKDKEIERLNTNWEVAVEDLSRIAKLLGLEESCTIYDIEDKIKRLNNIINELEKWLEEAIETISHISLDGASGLDMALTKIKELKGSDKG